MILSIKKENTGLIIYNQFCYSQESSDNLSQQFRMDYNPKMKVYHYQRSTRKGFAKQAFWNGYGRKQLNRIHPELKHGHQHGVGL